MTHDHIRSLIPAQEDGALVVLRMDPIEHDRIVEQMATLKREFPKVRFLVVTADIDVAVLSKDELQGELVRLLAKMETTGG